MNFKKLSAFLIFAAFIVAVANFALAVEVDQRTNATYDNDYSEDARNQGELVNIDLIEVKINGDTVNNGDDVRYDFERGSTLTIKVKLLSYDDEKNVEVTAMINGDDHNKIIDTTELFDTEAGVIYTKTLSLDLSNLVEQDNYKLRILVTDRYGAAKVYNYNLKIDTKRHALEIKDVIFSPDNEVQAGKALLSVVRVRNYGEKDEDSVKVTVSIPELGISASDYIDEIKADDQESSEELYMRIPNCANPGKYTATVTVSYDEGSKSTTKTYNINVVAGDTCNTQLSSEKTIITIGSEAQSLVAGQAGAVYPVSITNSGSNTKTFILSVDGADEWATVKISPTNVLVIDGGQTKTAYVYVTANKNAASGEHMFTINVQSGSEVLKQVPVKAVVSEGSGSSTSLAKALEVALIVLVIILVIVGLIVAFSKMKKEEKETETYY